jgi:uncharacterized membrane protein YfcA
VVGVLAGLFGIGGGWMIIPLLHVAFGVPVVQTAATSLFTMVPTSVSGAIRHLRQGTAHLRSGVLIGLSGALTSIVGALVSDYLPELLIVLLTVAVIGFSAVRMFWESRKKGEAEAEAETETEAAAAWEEDARSAAADVAADARSAAAAGEEDARSAAADVAASIVLGLAAGLVAGIVGVGGGFVIVPFCVIYLKYSMREAAGTSLVSIMFIALPGIVSHALLGHIWWLYGVALIVGTVPGAQLGGVLALRLPERLMRVCFVCLLVVAGGTLLVQQLVS